MDTKRMTQEGRRITFRIREDTVEQLQKVAEKNYMSMSAYIRRSIDNSLQQEVEDND